VRLENEVVRSESKIFILNEKESEKKSREGREANL
jgi:hypothetical protein